jgi:hypothetical protein
MNLKTLNIKSILKRVLYAALLLILLFCAWLALVVYHDESPDAGRDKFYATNQAKIPDNQNLAVAISGLNAPKGADIYKHGRLVVDTFLFDQLKAGESRYIIDAASTLVFVGKSDEFDCWYGYAVEKTAENCASPERIKTLLTENNELLNRYKSLYSLANWQGVSGGGGQSVLNLNRLVAADVKLNVDEGKPEIAYQKWRDNFVFINHILSADNTSIERAIFLVTDGFSLYSLEYLLLKSPEVGVAHIDELNILLKPSGLEKYNLNGMLRGEYKLVNNKLLSNSKTTFLHTEYIRNRLYRAHRDFLNSVLKPPSSYKQSQSEFHKRYAVPQGLMDLNWLDPYNDALSSMLTSGFIRSFPLIESMHLKNAQIKLLNLSLKIRQLKIADADIQAFLNQAGADYKNPFTNQPMRYDAAKKVIFCEELSSQHKIEVRL